MPLNDPVLILPVTDIDAALTTFGGSPAVVHCVRGVTNSVVVCPVALEADIEAVLRGTDVRVIGVEGGVDDAVCVDAALVHVDSSTVLVHDVHYALASPELRERVVAELNSGSVAVFPALAMVDSVKEVDGDGNVVGTVDRETIRSLQFPRGYQRNALVAGVGPAEVTFVAGDADAFALDLPRDAALAEAIWARRSG